MAQELTFNITEDVRRLKRPTSVKDFQLSFGHTDQGPTDVVIGDDGNIVQGRYGDSARQVFVNVVQGKNNEPVDITGYLPEFNGCIPDAEHIVIDNWDGVLVDPRHGRFRFDFPIQAFTVAGSYKQAYFRLVQNGTGKTLATLEFDMQVLEDFVYSNIVPQDYVTPYLDMINKLKDAYTNFVGKTQDSFDQAKKRLDDIMSTVEDKADTVEQRLKVDEQALTELSKKIDEKGLFTKEEAEAFKQEIQKQLDKLGDIDSYSEPGNDLIEKIINEADDRGINVRHFGATGDGETDDTDAFQKALDYATDHNHSAVYVPAGKYVITRELTLNFICLFGEGLTSSVLLPKGQISRLITLQWKSIVHNLRIDNSKVDGTIRNICLAPESGEAGTNNIVRNIYIEDSGNHEVTGIDASPKTNAAGQTIFSFPNVIDSVTMADVYNGIHLYSSKGGWVNGNVFQNITIQGFRHTGVWLDGGENRSSISHNSFSNIQVQYQKDTPDTARAFKINYGVNNKFTMIHTWQDQGTGKPIPSMELNPVAGATAWEIRNNIFDGIFESEIDGNAETISYNDLDGIRLSYWLNTSFKNGYGSLNTTKVFAQNMLPQNLISDFVAGKRSPLQWDNDAYKPTEKGIDDKGYYVKFTQHKNDPDAKSIFGLALNGPLDNLRNIKKYTIAIEFDLDGADNKDTSFQISSGYFNGGNRTVLSKGFHQMVKLRNGVYRYYETFNNDVESADPMFLYAYFGSCKAIKIRHFALVPGWIGPYQDIKESHSTKKWSIDSTTKIEFTKDFDDIITKLKLNLLDKNTNDWFDENLIQETQRSDGTYVYTYPIYI